MDLGETVGKIFVFCNVPQHISDGSRSTPNNLPKAATRARKKRTSESEDEDYVAVEDEATSKKKVLKKEYGTAAATKPGMKTKAPARRIPMSKARASTQVPLESEPKEAATEGKKRKERVKKTMARVVGKPSMMEDEEEEVAAPAPKAQKLMGDAIRSGAASSKPKEASKADAPKPKSAPRGIQGTFLLERRTRPQCLKLLLKKKMMRNMS